MDKSNKYSNADKITFMNFSMNIETTINTLITLELSDQFKLTLCVQSQHHAQVSTIHLLICIHIPHYHILSTMKGLPVG